MSASWVEQQLLRDARRRDREEGERKRKILDRISEKRRARLEDAKNNPLFKRELEEIHSKGMESEISSGYYFKQKPILSNQFSEEEIEEKIKVYTRWIFEMYQKDLIDDTLDYFSQAFSIIKNGKYLSYNNRDRWWFCTDEFLGGFHSTELMNSYLKKMITEVLMEKIPDIKIKVWVDFSNNKELYVVEKSIIDRAHPIVDHEYGKICVKFEIIC